MGWSDHCLSSGDHLPVFESDFLFYQLYDLGQITYLISCALICLPISGDSNINSSYFIGLL